MSVKTFRKTIRVGGVEVKSPRFRLKSDADRWYQAKLKEKQFQSEGVQMPIDKVKTLNDYFDNVWLPKRKKKYPVSTTYSDEQRYRDYVRQSLGPLKVSRINQLQVRTAIRNVVDKFGQSIQTRNRVRALLSKMFNDAMNEETPLRLDNPASQIRFDDPRKGKKLPAYIASEKDQLKFLKHAKSLSQTHFIYAALLLMAGMRKSEVIPLKWGDIDFDRSELNLNKRFMQAANRIVKGLKGGEDESHDVVLPDALMLILNDHREKSDFRNDDDFILSRDDGRCFGPREIARINGAIVEASGVKITPHGLRHTYGRQFVLKGGSVKALQAILGHSSSSTTELYSKLAGKGVNKFRNTVSYDIGDSDDE